MGTKGIPSAVPPAIRPKAHFSGADTPLMYNGITRPALLLVSGWQLLGESPMQHPSGFHRPAFANVARIAQGDPIIAFAYRRYSNKSHLKMQALFHIFRFLTKLSSNGIMNGKGV